MSAISAAERELDVLRAQKDRVRSRQLDGIRRSLISCPKCRKKSILSKWTFIKCFWYTPPRGCTEGDYWSYSGTKLCYMVCPKCQIDSYIYTHPQRKKIVGLIDGHGFVPSQIFEKVEKRHNR